MLVVKGSGERVARLAVVRGPMRLRGLPGCVLFAPVAPVEVFSHGSGDARSDRRSAGSIHPTSGAIGTEVEAGGMRRAHVSLVLEGFLLVHGLTPQSLLRRFWGRAPLLSARMIVNSTMCSMR